MVGIVTVLYNSEPVLNDFFNSLARQTYKDFILYLVDNKSPDKSVDVSRQLIENAGFQCILIENSENYGVAKANNIGIERALLDGCEFVLLSNNDVVLTSDTISILLNGLNRNDAFIAVPKIYYYGTTLLNYAAENFTYFTGCEWYKPVKRDNEANNRERICTYAPTCFMLIKRAVFERVGLMDERYFVYFDDTDFIYRVMEKGLKMIYIPESQIEHKISVCTGGGRGAFATYYMHRNLVVFSKKHYSLLHRSIIFISIYLKLLLRLILLQPRDRIRNILQAVKDGIVYYKQYY